MCCCCGFLAEWSLEVFGLYADEGDFGGGGCEVVDEEGEGEAVCGEGECLDLLWWDAS